MLIPDEEHWGPNMDRNDAAQAQTETPARPRWRTLALSVSTVEAVTESGLTPGPDGATYPSLHGS